MNIEGFCNKCTWWHLLLKYLLVTVETEDVGILLPVMVEIDSTAHVLLAGRAVRV